MTSSSHSSKASSVFPWSEYFRKLYKTSGYKLLEFNGAACLAVAFKIFVYDAYDDKLIRKLTNQWQVFLRGYSSKLLMPSVLEYILKFRGASCLVLVLKIL
jgi:hypothetical protein